jgi:hypothetical protein
MRSIEGEGDRVGTLQCPRADPIILTRNADALRPLPLRGRGLFRCPPSRGTIMLASVLLQLPPRRVERIPDRYLQIVMRMVAAGITVHHNRPPRQRQINVYPVQSAEMVLPVRTIQHHAAGTDAVPQTLQFLGALTHQGLGRIRRIHVAECNVQGERHSDLQASQDRKLMRRQKLGLDLDQSANSGLEPPR